MREKCGRIFGAPDQRLGSEQFDKEYTVREHFSDNTEICMAWK